MRTLPPSVTNESGSHGRVLLRPFTRRLCTNGVSVAACGARIVMARPWSRSESRWMTANGNSGLARTSSARLGTCGYRPSAANTYQDDISPRSSLPGMPPGEVDHSVFTTCRTVSCVLYGCPA